MESEFLELMPDYVKIYPFTGTYDFEGNPIRATEGVEYRARIVGKGLSVRRRSDEEDTVIYDVYIDAGNDVIRMEDKIELPPDQAWIDTTPEIFTVGRFSDEFGMHHTKIQCGWMYHRQGQ